MKLITARLTTHTQRFQIKKRLNFIVNKKKILTIKNILTSMSRVMKYLTKIKLSEGNQSQKDFELRKAQFNINYYK